MTRSVPSFRPEFLLLQQEGYLFRSCLTHGLTALRNANLHDVGQYYTAFFQLSIGLERLMKVIVMIEHAATHQLLFPPSTLLRAFRHDLQRLAAAIQGMHLGLPTHPLAFVVPHCIEWEILDHFNEFAKTTRYFNLDRLTTGTAHRDPLRRWKSIMEQIIKSDGRTTRAGTTQIIAKTANALEEHSRLITHDLEQQALTWRQYFESGQRYEEAAGQATYHTLRIIDALKTILGEVTNAAHAEDHRLGITDPVVPFMTEFLSFVDPDRQRVCKKKRWP